MLRYLVNDLVPADLLLCNCSYHSPSPTNTKTAVFCKFGKLVDLVLSTDKILRWQENNNSNYLESGRNESIRKKLTYRLVTTYQLI